MNQVTQRILECVKDIREVLREENAMGYLSIAILDSGAIYINSKIDESGTYAHGINHWSESHEAPDWWVDPTGGEE